MLHGEASESGELNAGEEPHDIGRTGRQRKAPTAYDNFLDDKTSKKEIRSYSSTAKKIVKKRVLTDNEAASVLKKSKGPKKGSDSGPSSGPSSTAIQKKTKTSVKAPVVVPVKEAVLSVREKEQLRIEEEFIAMQHSRSTPRHIPSPLPVGPSKPMEMSAAIKKGVKECSTLLLDWTKPAARLVGSICKVFWDGENEWFYARILNYDSVHNRHYVCISCIISAVCSQTFFLSFVFCPLSSVFCVVHSVLFVSSVFFIMYCFLATIRCLLSVH